MGLIPLPSTNDLIVWEREGRIWRFAMIASRCQEESRALSVDNLPRLARQRVALVWPRIEVR